VTILEETLNTGVLLGELDCADFLNAQSTPTTVMDRNLCFVAANPAYLAAVQRRWTELEGQFVFDAFPEVQDRVESIRAKFERTLAGETTYLDAEPFDITNTEGQRETRYWQGVQDPLRGQDGRVHYIIQSVHDVTETVENRRDRLLLAKELDHRTKNVLAVVQSITRLSSREHESKDEFVADLTSRIAAMSRNHSRLYNNAFSGLSLHDLLKDELDAMSLKSEFSLSGKDVMLNDTTARDLSMVVHELATNAAKYGCFAVEDGRLHVAWTEVGEDLVIEWRESGVGIVGPLNADGFGSKLFRMMRGIDCIRRPGPDGMSATLNCAGYKAT